MKFLADECCDAVTIEEIRDDGWDVLYVSETDSGVSDDNILKRANEEQRIIITEDKDFGELTYRLNKPSHGIILLRFNPIERHLKWPLLKKLINSRHIELKDKFVVVNPQKVRIRDLAHKS